MQLAQAYVTYRRMVRSPWCFIFHDVNKCNQKVTENKTCKSNKAFKQDTNRCLLVARLGRLGTYTRGHFVPISETPVALTKWQYLTPWE